MALIKTTEEIQQYVSVDINLQQKSVLPYMFHGENQIVRLLGKALYNTLHEYYNDDEATPDAALDALLPHVQRPLANFAIHYGLSALNVSINPTGIGVINTQNIAPASKDRTDALKKDLMDAAQDAMESLLEFLEENIDDYDDWTTSEAFAFQYDVLITSARKFDEIYRIERSRLKFLEWKPRMKDVEFLEIAPVVSQDFIDELKEQIMDCDLTEENEKILTYLQKALAYITAGQMLKDDKLVQVGTNFLMSGKRYMDTNISDFATYAASTAYDVAKPPYTRYINDPDSNFVVI